MYARLVAGWFGFLWMALLLLLAPPVGRAEQQLQWPTPAGDAANTRFSALKDIDAGNVASLKLSFAFSTGMTRGHEAAPIVTDNTMYIVTPYPNVLLALALDVPGTPLRWKYEPKPNASSQGVACCDTINRGATFADGRVFFNTLDAQTVASMRQPGRSSGACSWATSRTAKP